MNDKKSLISSIRSLLFPGDGTENDIRISAFYILALCGLTVSIITAFYNLALGFGIISFLECMAGVFISIGFMYYTWKTGNYRTAMILTVFVVFIGLFTFLYLTNGAYYSGVPYFFIFAVVFTAFLLDGKTMVGLVVFELLWYAGLCIYSYFNPTPTAVTYSEKIFVTDVIVCASIVSISLALTMFFQIRMYRKKEQQLNAAIKEAEEANKAKSDFLAKMSHDIRTPLNTIMAMNEMIVNNTSSAKIREWVNDSNVSARILLSLIDDMLDLSRIEAGMVELLNQPWDTRDLFDKTARTWKLQAVKSGLQFHYSFDPSVPGFLSGDEDAIRKIVNNLLSNAVKYTKAGSVSLSVRYIDELEIVIADTGVGIAPEYLGTIFKPFERGVEDLYRESSGSGLGLAIVKELVEIQKGKIDCQSVLNVGTVFTVRIPQRVIAQIAPSKSADNNSAEESFKDRFVAPDARVLVVDDNQYNRKVIKGFLEPALIQTDDVESGFEALEMIDIKDYDLILMDLRMPKMDGGETLDRIKEEYPDFNTPVVVLTADIMNDVEERLLKRGFSGFLAKPVNSAHLFDTIASFIPDKIVVLQSENEEELTLAAIERYQSILIPYGIDLKLALEYNAGNTGEFLTRAELFEEYADSGIDNLKVTDENYYLQVHSVKSIAKGIGAFLLAQLAESVELRNDDAFSLKTNPVILDEYTRVRKGLMKFREELGKTG